MRSRSPLTTASRIATPYGGTAIASLLDRCPGVDYPHPATTDQGFPSDLAALRHPSRLEPVARRQHDLAQSQDVRGHLDALVLADELQGLVEREPVVRHELDGVVGARGAHVRLLLLAHGVHVEVLGPRVLADHHALVDLLARADEELAALLQLEQREGGGLAAAVGDETAGRARLDLAVPGLVALEDGVHDPRATRLGEELGAEADQAARGDEVLDAHPAGAVVDHLLHPTLAQRQQLGRHTEVVLRDVYREPLDGLVELAVDLAGHDLRLAHGQLEALAAHRLDENRKLQLAAALDLPGVGPLGLEYADRHVAEQLLLEPVLNLARGEALARLAGRERRVDPDRHAERGLVDRDLR